MTNGISEINPTDSESSHLAGRLKLEEKEMDFRGIEGGEGGC